MEQYNLEIKIGKVAGLSAVFSFLMFWILAYVWPKTPDFIAYALIFIFIGGIVLYFARKFVGIFASKFSESKVLLVILSIIRQPLNLIVFITCLVIITYFGIRIYKELKPRTIEERKMECLKLGSDNRAAACMKLLK